MTAKETYREFCRKESSLPIFSRDWWLDATAGADAWNVTMVRNADQVVASMPYVMRRRYWLKVLTQPALTQKLGPWFHAGDGKPETTLANEKELMQTLIDQLPAFDYFNQNWHYNRTNWLPFSWNGFEQTTHYTYVLTELGKTEKLWSGFDNSTRAECKKALSRFSLSIRDDLPLEAFLALNRMTFARQGMSVPYSEAFVRRIDAACAERDCRKFFIAVDPEGRHHAGNYIVWDENSSYGLMNGSDPALRNSGAVSLCMWAAIKHAAQVTQRFDFMGSMLEPIERFFRGFGAVQVPYFNISKTPSRMLRVRQGLISVMSGDYRNKGEYGRRGAVV
ncbi:MAG: hypothetical protein V7642_4919 [Burkholderiales bacterium]|jgi:lipid II:glycine glycyltransferase (peptidoglycan interpeptide bridge formation enzyme)